MMNLKPDAHAYARAAHVRYLRGDVTGALSAMELSARSSTPRNRETFAWVWSKLSLYQLQLGERSAASESVRRALFVMGDSVHALRAEAQTLLYAGELERALVPLRKAARERPHPELLWMLADTLDALHRAPEAEAVRRQLVATGEREDPRTLALYLSARGESLARSDTLLSAELRERRDIYTLEALACLQAARGDHAAALVSARAALAHGTNDPRLLYHAGIVARKAGAREESEAWLRRAGAVSRMLLPSQRAHLSALLAAP